MRDFLLRSLESTSFFCFLLSFALFLPGSVAIGQSGRVFRDFNNNGIVDGSEPGMAGIGVRAYRSSGIVSGSALTDGAGLYNLLPAADAGDSLRIEFDVPDTFINFFPGASSNATTGNRTSVQFVVGPASDIDYALNYPTDFCEAGPPVSVVCFVVGAGTTVGDNLVATVPYSATGNTPGVVGHPNTPATGVGAIWETAFQTETGSLIRVVVYASAHGVWNGWHGCNLRDGEPARPGHVGFIPTDQPEWPGGQQGGWRSGDDQHERGSASDQ